MNAKPTATNISPTVARVRLNLAARQAEVEETRDLTEADLPPIAMTEAAQPMRGARNR